MKVLVISLVYIATVLGRPQIVNDHLDVVAVVQEVDPSYQYQYMVDTPETGDMHGHVENRDSGNNVTGRYMVLDPDGMMRIVNYRDIGNGFEVDVKRVPYAQPVIEKKPESSSYTNVAHYRPNSLHSRDQYKGKHYGHKQQKYYIKMRNPTDDLLQHDSTTSTTTAVPTSATPSTTPSTTTTTTTVPTTTTTTTTPTPTTHAPTTASTTTTTTQPPQPAAAFVVETVQDSAYGNAGYFVNMQGAGYNIAWGDEPVQF